MRTRLLAVAAVAALAAAVPATAASAPQITDPTGDARNQSAGADIVSALFGTQGTTAKVGRKTVYTPSKLVVTVTYAAAPSTDPYVSHQLTFELPGCGNVYMQVFNGSSTWGDADCLGEDATFDPSYKMAGSTITWTLPFNSIGKQYFKPGTALTDLVAYTAVAEPVLGIESQLVAGDAPVPVDAALDYATTTAAYKIS